MEDPSRPVTGYPAPGYPPPPHNSNPNGCPPPYYNNHHQNPYDYHYVQADSNPRAAFHRRLLSAMIGVSIIFCTLIFIGWFVLRPHLPEISVVSLSVSNFTVSPSHQVTGNWEVQFQAYNPNKKMSVAYDDIESSILYKSEFLSETRIAPFDQGTKNQTAVVAFFSASSTYVDGSVASKINGDRARGSVRFNVRLLARVWFKSEGWRWRRRLLRGWCDDVPVAFPASSGSGKLDGGSKKCQIGL